MASLIPGSLPVSSQLLTLSLRISFSQSETLGALLPASPASFSLNVYCGRGDKKTAKGKRFNHSFGTARPRNKKKGRGPPSAPVPPSPTRKDGLDGDDC